MGHLRKWLVLAVLLVPRSALAQAADAAAKPPQWWEQVPGILAIPAALLGLAYSYILIRKTRLEAHKTELEIIEKQKALGLLAQSQSEAAKQIVRPIIEGRQGQLLVLRCVLLYAVLTLWGAVESAFGFLLGLAFMGVQTAIKLDFNNPWIMFPSYFLKSLPKAVSWIIAIGIGWPLFRDLNAFLHIDLKSILMPWRK